MQFPCAVRSLLLLTVAAGVLALSCDYDDLDGVPAGFADGVDNQIYFEGTGGDLGTADTAARSDHSHSALSGTHYLTLGGEAFVPQSNVDYFNSGGNGGAYIVSGNNAMGAPVLLPHGATITDMTAHFYDNSTSDVTVTLSAIAFTGGYFPLGEVISSGTPGYDSGTDSTVDQTVDNTAFSYAIRAYSAAWDGNNTRVMAVTIAYTLSGA